MNPLQRSYTAALFAGGLIVALGRPSPAQEMYAFDGSVTCLDDRGGYEDIRGVLVVPSRDRRQGGVSDAYGKFSFLLPKERVGVGEHIGRIYLFAADTVIDNAEGSFKKRRRWWFHSSRDTVRYQLKKAIRLPHRLPCASVEDSKHTVADRDRLVREWQDALAFHPLPGEVEAGAVVPEGVESRPSKAGLIPEWAVSAGKEGLRWLASGATGFIGALAGLAEASAIGFGPGLCSNPDDLPCEPVQYTRVEVEEVAVELDRGHRMLALPLTAFSENPGFAFAAEPTLAEAPIWNPAASLLASRPQLGFQSDHEEFLRASGIVPLGPDLSIGGFYYQFDRRNLRFCELNDTPDGGCPDDDGDDPNFARDYMDGVVGTPGEPASLSGDPLVGRLGLVERVAGLTAGVRISRRVALGVAVKYLNHEVEVPRAVETLVARSTLRDGSVEAVFLECHPVGTSAGSHPLPTGIPCEGDLFPRLRRDVAESEGLDFDVSALFLVRGMRIGVNAMNVAGRTTRTRDGEALSMRALGVGAGYEIGRLNLGGDLLFYSAGGPEVALGANYELLDRAFVRLGYTAELASWSIGAVFRGATYTYVSGGPLGDRHLSGFQIRF